MSSLISVSSPTRRIFNVSANPISLLLVSRSYSGQAGTVGREARFLKKLMVGTAKSKRKWFTVDQTPSKSLKDFNFISGSVIPAEKRQKSGRVTRRVNVLNTVFMEQITSLLATGDAGIDILGLGLEISRVQMSSDFTILNIYWYATGTEKDELLVPILDQISFNLRHKLTQLRVIGYVPPIKFVLDDQFSKIVEVEKIFEKADYGEDYQPTEIGRHFKSKPAIPSSTISPELRNKIEELASKHERDLENSEGEREDEDNQDQEADSVKENLDNVDSAMRQDILGINHTVLMNQVTEAMKRMRYRGKNTQSSSSANLSPAEITDSGEEPAMSPEEAMKQIRSDKIRRIEFLNFLKTRRIEKAKEMKRFSDEVKEREFYEDQLLERFANARSSIVNEFEDQHLKDDSDDYYEDEFDERERSNVESIERK